MKLTKAEQLCWDVMCYAALSEKTSELTGKELKAVLEVLFGEDMIERLLAKNMEERMEEK